MIQPGPPLITEYENFISVLEKEFAEAKPYEELIKKRIIVLSADPIDLNRLRRKLKDIQDEIELNISIVEHHSIPELEDLKREIANLPTQIEDCLRKRRDILIKMNQLTSKVPPARDPLVLEEEFLTAQINYFKEYQLQLIEFKNQLLENSSLYIDLITAFRQEMTTIIEELGSHTHRLGQAIIILTETKDSRWIELQEQAYKTIMDSLRRYAKPPFSLQNCNDLLETIKSKLIELKREVNVILQKLAREIELLKQNHMGVDNEEKLLTELKNLNFDEHYGEKLKQLQQLIEERKNDLAKARSRSDVVKKIQDAIKEIDGQMNSVTPQEATVLKETRDALWGIGQRFLNDPRVNPEDVNQVVDDIIHAAMAKAPELPEAQRTSFLLFLYQLLVEFFQAIKVKISSHSIFSHSRAAGHVAPSPTLSRQP